MDIKPITKGAIPAAIQKAERYRLLNDSTAAESICLDILDVDPTNQQALVNLLLSISDQLGEDAGDGGDAVRRARDVLPKLEDEYKRAYYAGIVAERKAKSLLRRGGPGAAHVAHDWFREAMGYYEQAEKLRPKGNDEAILRWNTCVRMMNRHEVRPASREESQPLLSE